jgi:hypothetical protein
MCPNLGEQCLADQEACQPCQRQLYIVACSRTESLFGFRGQHHPLLRSTNRYDLDDDGNIHKCNLTLFPLAKHMHTCLQLLDPWLYPHQQTSLVSLRYRVEVSNEQILFHY